MNLLPASVDLVDSVDLSQASDLSTSLVPRTLRAITTQGGQSGLVPSADAFAWPSSTRRSEANFIDGTPVEDSDSDETVYSSAEYVSGWSGSNSVERMAIAQYLANAAGPAVWSGRLINLYA